MTISTIITVYNLEAYIAKALDSVFAQTRLPNEVIVIDDASTDQSASIIQHYGNKVKYVRMPENSGVMLSFLKGIAEAKGEILSFLDGDDIWHNTKLEKIEAAFIADQTLVMVTHDYDCIDGQNNPIDYHTDPTHQNTQRIVKQCKGNRNMMSDLLKDSILCYKGVWLGSAFCLRKSYIDFDRFTKWVYTYPTIKLAYQDHPLAMFIVNTCLDKRIYFIDDVLFSYRIFDGNTSSATTNRHTTLKTLSRAMVNAQMTLELTQQSQNQEAIKINKKQLQKLTFMYNLYMGNTMRAMVLLLKASFDGLSLTEIIKECKRFLIVTIFGLDKFLQYK